MLPVASVTIIKPCALAIRLKAFNTVESFCKLAKYGFGGAGGYKSISIFSPQMVS